MRAPKFRTIPKPDCVICKCNICVDHRLSTHYRRLTRSITKQLQAMEVIILEIYRSMPLLGDENEKVPDWDIHIVHYSIVFKYTKFA